MTRKKRRKQSGRRYRQRALRREREKLRRERSKGPTVAVEPAAEESPVQDAPPASMPTGTADPREPETPRWTRKQRRQRRKQLEQAKKRKRLAPVAKGPTADGAETAGELQSEAAGELPPDTSPRRRGRPPKPELKDSDLSGFKHFDELAPRFEALHEFGCERDKAGNRTLHYDQFCMGMLLALFNPIVESLGGLDQATQFSRIRERLGVERMSVSSLSEAARLFDADALIPIIQSLGEELQPLGKDPRLAEVKHTLTLVDGTLLSALPKILQAVTLKKEKATLLVVLDRVDHRARILEMRTFDGRGRVELLAFVFAALEAKSRDTRLSVVVDVCADAVDLQEALEKLGCLPTVYYPSLVAKANERVDAVQYTRLFNAEFAESLCYATGLAWPEAKRVVGRVQQLWTG
jgi:hypothetical protein